MAYWVRGAAARRLRRWPSASLDRDCARRSTRGQVGTKGWVCPIEQRDASFDLSSATPPPMTDLLNFAHTTGRNLGRNPRIGVLPFLMLKADVALLSKISRRHGTMGRSR